jgi:hypothetical protein
MATAKAVRAGTFLVGREAPHQKCPKQTGKAIIGEEHEGNL